MDEIQQKKQSSSSMRQALFLLSENYEKIYNKYHKITFFYDTIQVKITMHHVLYMGILVLMNILTTLGNGDVLNLTVSTFKQARQQFQYLLVYYYDNNCKQCTKTTQLFYTFVALVQNTAKPDDVEALNSIKKQNIFSFHRNLQFSMIQARENQDIFKQEIVDSVPEFRIYKKNQLKYYTFNVLGLTYQKLWMFASWVRRATESSIPEFQDISSIEGSVLKHYTNKSVIVDCKYLNLIQKIRKSDDYMINLDIDYVCLKNSNLRNQNILLKQNNYNNKISYCDHNINKNDKDGVIPGWRNCENQIKTFRFRGSLVRWTDQLINSIYHENRSVLVLLTNNESASWEYVRKLTELKNSLEDRQEQQILPIFAIADLHYDLQGTIRLKKFIGGYDLKGWPYPYPILAYLYLEYDNQVVKYIYQQKYNNSIDNSLSISDWLRMAQQRQLQRDLRGLNCTPQIDLISQKQQRTIYKIFLSQLLLMVHKHSKSNKVGQQNEIPAIFVFVLWRHSYEMQLLSSKMKKWWASIQFDAYFYILDLVENDLPDDIKINNLPALITYFKNGKRQVWQGIKELKEVKNIVEKAFKK